MAKHLLWVDDEAELLEPHRIFLRERGYDVELVANADDALDLVRSQPFDLVLLDEQMPGKRGLEVYRELRELAPNLPVVMVTKSEEDATFREAIGANVRDYLVKPVNPRQVLAAVARLLEGATIRSQAVARAIRRAVPRPRAGARHEPRLARLDRPVRRADAVGRRSRGCRRDGAATTRSARSIPTCTASSRRSCGRVSGVACRARGRPAAALRRRRRRSSCCRSSARGKPAVFIVVDCLRLDQWRVLEPLLGAVLRRRDDALLRGAADGDALLAQRAVQRASSRASSPRASRTGGASATTRR